MSDTVHTVSIDQLLAHRAWVRSLARRLVASDAEADDVEQDTWLAALRAPPREGRVRGWLATVVRNAARQRARAAGRRAHWESLVEAAPPAGAAAEVVERAEAHQHVVRAVMGLDEPYRATVLLRFFDGLPPREVADRLGVPVETVRTRTRRALALLRRWLDGEHGGDGRAWCLALLPLVRRPETAIATAAGTMGVLAMGAAAKWVAGGVVLLVLAGLAWQMVDESGDPVAVSAGETVTPDVAPDEEVVRSRTRIPKVSPEPDRVAPEDEVPAEPLERTVRVTLHDSTDVGIGGARVLLVSGDAVLGKGVTAASGEVELAAPEGALRVVAVPPFRPLVIGRVESGASELSLGAPDGHEVAGVLRVDGAAPPPRTWIRLLLTRPHTEYAELPTAVWQVLGRGGSGARVSGTVGPEGRFHFRGLPDAGAAQILLHPAFIIPELGHGQVSVAVPDRTVVLDAITLPVVRGRVVHADGTVAGGAHIWLESESPTGVENMGFRTSADGLFEVRMADAKCTSAVLKIVGPGSVGWRELVLDPPPRTARNLGDVALSETRRVEFHVEAAGVPVAGAIVTRSGAELASPTDAAGVTSVTLDVVQTEVWVGALGHLPVRVVVEPGEPGPFRVRLRPDTLVRIAVRRQDPADRSTGLFVVAAVPEGAIGRASTPVDAAVGATPQVAGARRGSTWLLEPDEADQIVVTGLHADREVLLRLIDVTGVVHAERTVTPAAGRPLDLELGERAGGRMITGTVTGADGAPLDGANVTLAAVVPGAPPTDLPRWMGPGQSMTTDAAGSYSLGPIFVERGALRALAAGHGAGVVSVDGVTTADVALVLAQEVTVHVVDEQGAARTDAVVSFVDPGLATFPAPPRARMGRRTAEGAYTLRDVPQRRVEITVRVDGISRRFQHDGRHPIARLAVPSTVDAD